MSADYDLVIRSGTIVDGSGGALFQGDVAVKDGRIAAVGAFEGAGAEELDASGKIVTPGFVDVHTHYDGQAIWSDTLSPSSSHGVTTVLVGNCGVGFAPCRREDHDLLISVMEGVEDIPGVVMAEGLPWDWETFPQYLDALDARPRDIDIAAYLPHSPLRVYAMGERGAGREPANDDDLARMRALAKEAVEAGAIGFASSRLGIHRTADGDNIPSYEAPISELRAIVGGMEDAGSGTFQIVLDPPLPDNTNDLDSVIEIAEESGRPVTFTLALLNNGPPIFRDVIGKIADANARGARMSAQVLPRPIGLLSGLELSINPFVLCPSWAKVADLSTAEKVEAMRNPDLRAALLSETPDEGHPLAMLGRMWNWMFPLGDPPNYAPSRDESVGAQAKAKGVTPLEWAYDYLVESGGQGMFYGALGNYYEGRLDALEELINHPDCILGLGDGGAHYGAICDASHPTFLLTHWVRGEKRIPIEEAVHMLSAKPAKAVGLEDRGLIVPGMKADLNVIDLDGMRLHAPHVTNDLPAGGRRLDQYATGYDATIVSGEVIRRFDKATGALPGRLVRGAQSQAA